MLKLDSALAAQAIVITDPLLARYVLRSKLLDKFRFLYSFLDPVRIPLPARQGLLAAFPQLVLYRLLHACLKRSKPVLLTALRDSLSLLLEGLCCSWLLRQVTALQHSWCGHQQLVGCRTLRGVTGALLISG